MSSTSESCEDTSIRILTVQWNVGNARPKEHELSDIIVPNHGNDVDLIVFGLQESTYKMPLSRPSYEMPKMASESVDSSSSDMKHRKIKVKDTLAPCYQDILQLMAEALGHDFVVVKTTARVQMQLIIFCRKKIRHLIRDIETSKENTGFLHVFPNKGGLCVKLTIGETSFAFISCHLTAQEGTAKCAQRNDSLVEILGGVRFGDKRFDPTLLVHHTILMGDLNYRITFDPVAPCSKVRRQSLSIQRKSSLDQQLSIKTFKLDSYSDMPFAEQMMKVLDLIQNESWDQLQLLDELTREMAAGRALDTFTALPTNFPPTFKRYRVKGYRKYIRMTQKRHSGEEGLTLAQSSTNEDSKDPANDNSLVIKVSDLSVDDDDEDDDPNISISRMPVVIPEELSALSSHSSQYNLQRMPSYTDRILFKSLPRFSSEDFIKPLCFESCEAVTTSDHKPVRACFEVKLIGGARGIMLPRNDHKLLIRETSIRKLSSRSSGEGLDQPRGLRDVFSSARMSFRRSFRRSGRLFDFSTRTSVPNSLTIEISRLACRDLAVKNMEVLGVGGMSDPYVMITADPIGLLRFEGDGDITSSVIFGELNPVWEDEVIRFDICTVDIHGLSDNSHLFLSVWDHNTANAHVLIGLMALSFKTIFEALVGENDEYNFRGDLYSHSLKQGELSGCIQVTPVHVGKDGAKKIIPCSLDELSAASPSSLRMSSAHTLAHVQSTSRASFSSDCQCNIM